ncbi:hypothetical protein QBC34DRAFT_431843 [Podospora aff. communis PSN243]|uniref:Uncharacterized protein n=1 Tax=Podospora aff. communis PSN243 TaxID=3040156 RepID=A0AAV9FY13_9PEZI|nr:hypothetical protein QBC34DRAFT_431843 [Podospora aff. communis PSN243]
MSFFNFEPSPDEYLVSSHIWIYIGLTIPLTALVVFGWWWWERVRERKLRLEEAKLEESIEETEKNIFPEMGTTGPETDWPKVGLVDKRKDISSDRPMNAVWQKDSHPMVAHRHNCHATAT